MIGLAIFVVALAAVGTFLIHLLWQRTDPDGLAGTPLAEILNAGALFGLGIWMAVSWILALTHRLDRPHLGLAALVVVLAGVTIAIRHRHAFSRTEIRADPRSLLILLPLVLWLVTILWRGAILPTSNHDALAYHFPKAVYLERAVGWELFQAPDYRITRYPFNYELLLANTFILEGTDTYTEWIGTISYVLMLLASAALVQRWSTGLQAVLATVIAVGGAPLLLLHSGADKNDLLVGWLAISALLWGSRWVIHGGRLPMLLLLMALALILGTKISGMATAIGLAPFVLVRLWNQLRLRAITPRDIGLTLSVSLLLFLTAGGFIHAMNFIALAPPTTATLGASLTETATSLTAITWGEWNNLWQVPLLALAVPFLPNPGGVWLRVPWSENLWLWPHYEIFFSHYGWLFTPLVLLLPWAIRYQKTGEGSAVSRERAVAGLAGILAVAVMLPTVIRPVGWSGTMLRYFMFTVPLIAAIVVPAVLNRLAVRSPRLGFGFSFLLAVIFTVQAGLCFVKDRFAPLEYVLWAINNPGTRVIFFYPNRAGSVVDRAAGPHDTIAVDGGFDSWLYPAYGRNRTRQLIFLGSGTTPDSIPSEARWVMIDRSWQTLWSELERKGSSQPWKEIGKGGVTGGLTPMLLNDSRFRLVFHDEKLDQAVFVRTSE